MSTLRSVCVSLVAFDARIFVALACLRHDQSAARVRPFRWVMRHQRLERGYRRAHNQFHA